MAYNRVNWQNSVATPVNANNLNIMDVGLNDHETSITDHGKRLIKKAEYSTMYILNNIETIDSESIVLCRSFYDDFEWNAQDIPDDIYKYIVKPMTTGTVNNLQFNHAYALGDLFKENGIVYKCIQAGTSPGSISFPVWYLFYDHKDVTLGSAKFIMFDGATWYDTGQGFYVNELGHVTKSPTSTKKLVAIADSSNAINILALGAKPWFVNAPATPNDCYRIIQGACNNYRTVRFPSRCTIDTSQTIIIYYTHLYGDFTSLNPLVGGTYIGNFVLMQNSVDGVNMYFPNFRNSPEIIGIKFINKYNIVNMKAMFVACSGIYKRILTNGYYQSIVIASDYMDTIDIDDVTVQAHQGSLYAIEQLLDVSGVKLTNGDSWRIRKIYTTDKINLLHFQAGNSGLEISGITNGNILLENCQAKVSNCHLETTNLIIKNAKVQVDNSTCQFQTGGVAPIQLQTDVNGKSNSVVLKNISFVIPHWSANNGLSKGIIYDCITVDDNYDANIYIENCGYGNFKTAACGLRIRTATSHADVLRNNSAALSKFGIVNAKSAISPIKIIGKIPTNNVFSSKTSYTKPSTADGPVWQDPTASYFYRATLWLDVTRAIGIAENISEETNITLTNGGSCLLVKLLEAEHSNILNARLILYRGDSTGSYNQSCDIPIADASAELYETGNCVMYGYWQSISTVTSFNVNPYSNIEKDLVRGTITAYGTATPSYGTWSVGDRIVNSTPTVGQPKAWICTAAGTPGTWVSEGNL